MKANIKFQIQTIQRNKIIMATEAIVTNSSVAIGIYLTNRFVQPGLFQDILIISGGIFGIAFSLYASIGNIFKHNKIKSLQKQLQLKN